MAKKKKWFDRVKQFFGADAKSKLEKKDKRRRWLLGRFKLRSSATLPAPLPRIAKSEREISEQHSRHAMAVAVATTVAVEAAIAAAEAAAEFVRITGTSLSRNTEREIAATKIQTAFRGYLARKALHALKGLVRLQALIRGQAVRRQTSMSLRSLQSLMKIQSEARASRVRIAAYRQAFEDEDIIHTKLKRQGEMQKTLQQYNARNWDSSTLSKEDISAMLKTRLMAALKRERTINYASSRQENRNSLRPTTPVTQETDTPNQSWAWFDQWAGTPRRNNDIYMNVPLPSPEHNLKDDQLPSLESRVIIDSVNDKTAEENQLRFLARRSFQRHILARDNDSITSSPCLPSYMASTASAKARFRSMSTPKQRPATADFGVTDAYSDHCPSVKSSMPSPFPSVASETIISKTGNHVMSHQNSPLQWGQTGSIRSRRSPKHYSFDSECSLLNWDRRNSVR